MFSHVSVGDTLQVTGSGLAKNASHLPRLCNLSLEGCPKFQSSALGAVRGAVLLMFNNSFLLGEKDSFQASPRKKEDEEEEKEAEEPPK